MKYSLRSLMTFSIRDLFLVTMIVALAVGWWANRRQLAIQCDEAERQRDDALAKAGDWKFKAKSLAETMKGYGWKIDIDREALMTVIGPSEDLPNSSAPPPNP
jgi:hypothetical protein